MLQSTKEFLLCASAYGAWDILSLMIVIGGAAYGYLRFFRPVRAIRNLTVFFNFGRDAANNFPLQLLIEFTNHTGRSLYITSVWFKCSRLRPDPNGRCDAGTGRLEIKFPRDQTGSVGQLSDFEHFLRDGESVATFAPLDPGHSDDEVRAALQSERVGHLDCFVTLLSRDHKSSAHKLRARPKKDYGLRLGIFRRLLC